MIKMLVGRIHVGCTDLQCIRQFMQMIEYGQFKTLPRRKRRSIICEVVKQHHKNRRLYAWVMGGLKTRRP